MSDPLEPEVACGDGEGEEVHALVPAAQSRLALVLPSPTKVVGVAALASGFLAGVATVSLMHGRRRRAPARVRARRLTRRSSDAQDLIQIVASRSLLVDVHLLDTGRGR